MNYNKVILAGRLTRDPEIRYTQSNSAVLSVGLAVNRRYKKADGEWAEEVTFVDVTMFGKRAEAFEKFHKKGNLAFFEGRLKLDTWDDRNTGQKRQKLSVVAEEWTFATSDKNGEPTEQRQPASRTRAPQESYSDDFSGLDPDYDKLF